MERQIGEIFKDGEVMLMVRKCDSNKFACGNCYYLSFPKPCYDENMIVCGECLGIKRKDKKDVNFIRQD